MKKTVSAEFGNEKSLQYERQVKRELKSYPAVLTILTPYCRSKEFSFFRLIIQVLNVPSLDHPQVALSALDPDLSCDFVSFLERISGELGEP